jgi:cell division septation protein DedD
MANLYQDRPFPADDDYDRGDVHARPKAEGDPLAELARLIGQTDPFANFGRDNPAPGRDDRAYQQEQDDDNAPSSPPPWMQRANAHDARHETRQDYVPQPSGQRYQDDHYEDGADYHQAPSFVAASHDAPQADPNRYDDALYGQLPGQGVHAQDENYQDDSYAYPDGYGEVAEEPQKRRGGMMTVAVVLALAVVGTGAAFAYRTFVGSPRSGEPPVIKADAGPNKVVPPSATGSADANGKLIQDRLGGAAPEKLVSREEQPVNVQDSTKAGPRVVFPPLNVNANPPSTASVSPAGKAMTGNANVQGGADEPRKIRTFAVKGDQDPNATPAAKQVPGRNAAAPAAAVRSPAANANASASAPLSLSPQAAPATAPAARVASTTAAPTQIAPTASSGSGGYLVQIASQRNEADAQASFRALQGKYPSVLGSRTATIKRADLGEKGTYYRAMVGPFGSPDEATTFCGNLKSAGGQCVVQRN